MEKMGCQDAARSSLSTELLPAHEEIGNKEEKHMRSTFVEVIWPWRQDYAY